MSLRSKPIGEVIASGVLIAFFATIVLGMVYSLSGIEPPIGRRAPLAEEIAADLRAHPERWSGDGHHIYNDRWVLWIANDWYKLEVCAYDHSRPPERQTCVSGDADFNDRSSRHIWAAAQGAIKQVEARRMAALTEATRK